MDLLVAVSIPGGSPSPPTRFSVFSITLAVQSRRLGVGYTCDTGRHVLFNVMKRYGNDRIVGTEGCCYAYCGNRRVHTSRSFNFMACGVHSPLTPSPRPSAVRNALMTSSVQNFHLRTPLRIWRTMSLTLSLSVAHVFSCLIVSPFSPSRSRLLAPIAAVCGSNVS